MQGCPRPREQAWLARIAARFAEFAKTAPGRVPPPPQPPLPPRRRPQAAGWRKAVGSAGFCRCRTASAPGRTPQAAGETGARRMGASDKDKQTGDRIYSVHDMPRIPLLVSAPNRRQPASPSPLSSS